MDEVINLTDFLSRDYPLPGKEEERNLLLFLLSLPDRKDNEEVLEEGKRRYAPFIKNAAFSSISLSPFDTEEDKESLVLDSVKAFVLYSLEKKKRIPSLLLSFRYFLTVVFR